MKTTIIFSLLLFICLIQGCVSPNSFPLKGEKKMVLNNSERVLSVTSLSSYQLILLETNDNSLIKDINRMYCYEDTLFVFDRFMKKIILFNKRDGTYINTISHVGQGPGEYVKAMDFCIDSQNKRIIITCDIPYKLLFYSFSGDLQKEVSLPLYYSEIVTNGTYLYGLIDDEDNSKIDILDYNGNQINSISIPNKKLKIDTPELKHTFAKGHRMAVYKDSIYFTCPYDNSIYTIKEEELYKKYEIDFKEYTLPEHLLNEELNAKDFSMQCKKNSWVCTILDIIQSSDSLFFRTNSGFFLCNKENNSMTNYRILSLPNIGGTSFIQAVNGTNEFVEIIHSNQFKRMIDVYLKYQGKTENIDSKLWELYESITDESNPILIICKI